MNKNKSFISSAVNVSSTPSCGVPPVTVVNAVDEDNDAAKFDILPSGNGPPYWATSTRIQGNGRQLQWTFIWEYNCKIKVSFKFVVGVGW